MASGLAMARRLSLTRCPACRLESGRQAGPLVRATETGQPGVTGPRCLSGMPP
jgi:hypothetical protein